MWLTIVLPAVVAHCANGVYTVHCILHVYTVLSLVSNAKAAYGATMLHAVEGFLGCVYRKTCIYCFSLTKVACCIGVQEPARSQYGAMPHTLLYTAFDILVTFALPAVIPCLHEVPFRAQTHRPLECDAAHM